MSEAVNESPGFTLEKVNPQNIDKAIAYISKIFEEDSHYMVTGLPLTEVSLRASIEPEKHQEYKAQRGIGSQQEYYILKNENDEIVGSIGYYTKPQDEEDAAWIGWFSIDPRVRGKNLGTKLLEEVEDLAKTRGKKYLRLYTSEDPNEAAAQRVYERFGLEEKRRYTVDSSQYQYIFREKSLEREPEPIKLRQHFNNHLVEVANSK